MSHVQVYFNVYFVSDRRNNEYLGSKLIVFRGETLAVSAPWSIKFNQNVLRFVVNDVVERFSHNNLPFTKPHTVHLRLKLNKSKSSSIHTAQ
jgi:hypothetical protein